MLNHEKEQPESKQVMAELLVTFLYLKEEKVEKEIYQDVSGLDHGQEQPESQQGKAELLETFYTGGRERDWSGWKWAGSWSGAPRESTGEG